MSNWKYILILLMFFIVLWTNHDRLKWKQQAETNLQSARISLQNSLDWQAAYENCIGREIKDE